MNRNLFPLGKAYGAAFCNRVAETDLLLSNIQSTKHTLLVAPRRFGKSSLAERAIEKSKLPAVKLNFHLCTSEEEVSELILSNITKLLGITIGPAEKVVGLAKKFLKTIRPKISFFGDTASLELSFEKHTNMAVVIAEGLLMLDKLLASKGLTAVMFLDEFQELTKITSSTHIEGAIRTAAQEMTSLSLIFSGSIRSLLLSMFENENRPLYKLCRKIHLQRISADDYIKHIQKIAKKSWKEPLSQTSICSILELSNRHPYYINYLCDTVWQMAKNLPTSSCVEKAWHQVIREEWSDAVREVSELPMTQRRLLKMIAKGRGKNLRSQEISAELNLATSSITSAMNALAEKDYIEATNDHYQIINPLLGAVLTQDEPGDL